MALIVYGNTLRGRWYFEHHNSFAVPVPQFMYLDERMPTRSLIGNLFLHCVERRTAVLVLAADNLVRMVLHTENQPSARPALQICFVAQCRKVLSQIPIVEIAFGPLELHHFRFRRQNQ